MKLEAYQKLILIDDDGATNAIHIEIIESLALTWEISVIRNSTKAIEYLNNLIDEPAKLEKTLVLLDINLPGYNGWEILEKIDWENRSSEITGQIDMVILTASRNPGERLKSNRVKNIRGFLNKPLSIDKMNELLMN